MKTVQLKSIVLTAAVLFIQVVAFAQPGREGRPGEPMKDRLDEMKAKKIAYLSGALNLKPAEAEVFWPIYNEFDEGMMTFHKEKIKAQMKHRRDEKGGNDPLSDEEAQERILEQFKAEQDVLNHRKTYYEKFKKVLSPSQILKLYEAEMRFRMEVVKDFGERERERRH